MKIEFEIIINDQKSNVRNRIDLPQGYFLPKIAVKNIRTQSNTIELNNLNGKEQLSVFQNFGIWGMDLGLSNSSIRAPQLFTRVPVSKFFPHLDSVNETIQNQNLPFVTLPQEICDGYIGPESNFQGFLICEGDSVQATLRIELYPIV